jgi:hypothetical protein
MSFSAKPASGGPDAAFSRQGTPYGQSFAVADLMFVRDWVQRREFSLSILLDQVLDGAEFEELLLIRAKLRGRPALTLWRTSSHVIAQAAGGQPHAFSGVQPALAYLSAARREADRRKFRPFRTLSRCLRACFTR